MSPRDKHRSEPVVSSWCNSLGKRIWDILLSFSVLVFALPLVAVLAVIVKLSFRGSVMLREQRSGRLGRRFYILQFRTTACDNTRHGPLLVRPSDVCTARLSHYMRKWRLDKLPQLLNVLWGDMSLVGPHPQSPKFWNQCSFNKQSSSVLTVRPGLTSESTLVFKAAETLVSSLPSEVDECMQAIMPLKLRIEASYLKQATFNTDLRIIFWTICELFKKHHTSEMWQ